MRCFSLIECCAVSNVPSYLLHQYTITDLGASVTATGNIKDFKPDNVTALEVPMPMDGIMGSLMGTHKEHCGTRQFLMRKVW